MRVLGAVFSLMASTALAGDDPIVLILENQANRAIEQLAIFPVGDGGEVMDDVLMARHDPVAAHETVALDTRLIRCGQISLWLRFMDGEEVSGQTDLCKNNRLIAHD